MIETEVLVPLRDNAGQPFPIAAFEELEIELFAFGGWQAREELNGAWRDAQGRAYYDRMRPYVVALESWRQIPDLLKLFEWVRVRFGQEAIYVKIAGVPEIMGPAP